MKEVSFFQPTKGTIGRIISLFLNQKGQVADRPSFFNRFVNMVTE